MMGTCDACGQETPLTGGDRVDESLGFCPPCAGAEPVARFRVPVRGKRVDQLVTALSDGGFVVSDGVWLDVYEV